MTSPELGSSIDVAGVATNVHVAGDGDPVLLLHGSGPGVSAWANWRLTIPVLAQRFRVIAPDIVGFGFTDRPEQVTYDLDTWTSHALGVLDTLGIERAHVVGNSFGSSLALSLAIRHPDRVGRLVLMGAVGVPFAITPGLDAVWGYEPSVDAMEGLLHLFAHDRSLIGPDLARLRYEASVRPGVQEAYREMFPVPRQRALDAMTHQVDEIAGIAAPTLIVHGRDDQVIPLQNAIDLLGLIDDAQLHVFGHCGHWTQLEHAAEFTALVTDFLLSGTTAAVHE
jgi:2-hydroxymuconate-semialdehyde hydrolase